MIIGDFQLDAAAKRYEESRQLREKNQALIDGHRELRADDPTRIARFLQRHGFQGAQVAAVMSGRADHVEKMALERILGNNDLMGVAFLEGGIRAGKSVGKITMTEGGSPIGFGTGFLVSPHLLLTNHHVLGDPRVAANSYVEFEYQVNLDGGLRPTTTFALEPQRLHLADKHLDYALVAVAPTSSNGTSLSNFGCLRLRLDDAKAITAQWVNIIQHPNGEPKQLSLRENQVIAFLDEFVQYLADTAPGSSGSPVFNDIWEVIALHHSGVPARNAAGQILATDGQLWSQEMGEHRVKWIANEGVRVSRILAHLRMQPLPADKQRLLNEALVDGPPAPSEGVQPTSTAVAVPPPAANGQDASVSVSGDGTATWTIPLTVSVRLPLQPTASQAAAPPSTPAIANGAPRLLAAGSSEEALLAAARQELAARQDVKSVRLGYVFRNGWITKQRAIVVTLGNNGSPAPGEAATSGLPPTIQGLPVEVTGPTLLELIAQTGTAGAAEALRVKAAVAAEEIKYAPPRGSKLEKVKERMRVVAHASPDHGWPLLKSFLGEAKQSLVVGMYDFGAPHILKQIQTLAKRRTFKKLALVIQKGESVGTGTKADDLRDADVIAELGKSFKRRFQTVYVKLGATKGWVSSSYHIKVAVRDQSAFWLSSGNWQSSNQPDADPLAEDPARRKWLTDYNREWHVIVEHKGLAKTYETFLLNDLAANEKLQAEEAVQLPDLVLPELLFAPGAEERRAAFEYFQPFDEDRQFVVTPVLSPDNYFDTALALVKSAKKELIIQNQTFNAPRENDKQLEKFLGAVLERLNAGVKVRIIFRILRRSDARANLEALQDYGFDVTDGLVKVQKNCHTKGIIVDGKKVLVGSQNISNQGISVNRDASLLFEDEPLAQYYKKLFEHDWRNLAKQDIGSQVSDGEVATAETATPEGAVRLTWKDYMEMLA